MHINTRLLNKRQYFLAAANKPQFQILLDNSDLKEMSKLNVGAQAEMWNETFRSIAEHLQLNLTIAQNALLEAKTELAFAEEGMASYNAILLT